MKVRVIDLGAIHDQDDFRLKCAQAVKSIQDVVNGKIEFVDNIDSSMVTVQFSTANTNTMARHGLGRKPTGYMLVGATAAMEVIDGTGENTAGEIYLKSTAAGTARIIVF